MARARPQPPAPVPPVASGVASWGVPLAIALVTLIPFAPALGNGFVSWDDGKNFVENQHYRGLGPSQLHWMWTTFHMGHYVPLTWMTLGADYLFWGMDPAGYHATSILIHSINAVLVYFVARRLIAAAMRLGREHGSQLELTLAAAFAALAFAVHPLRVESVAWITERRDTLSLAFYLLTVLAYLRFAESPSSNRKWYWIALPTFACALLSKGTSVSAPAVLLLLNVYPLRRLSLSEWRSDAARRIAVELIPFIVLSIAFSALSIVALHPPKQLDLAAKIAVSAYSLEFYISKTVLPFGLSPLYEMPQQVDPGAVRYIVAYVACVALALVAWSVRKKWPSATAAIVAFGIITLPLLGIVQNGPQIAADRYTYHSGPALSILAGAALFFAAPFARGARTAIGAAVVVMLGLMTWDLVGVWHDSESLWSRVLVADSTSAIGHSAMANIRYKQGRIDEGLAESERSLALAPTYPEAHADLGVGLVAKGQLADAAAHYREAIALRPTYDEAYNNLGIVLAREGDIDGAIEQFRHALQINPDFADAHVNWGNALVRGSKPAEAIPHYQQALALRPDDAEAHHNWGVALAQQGRFAEAAEQFRETLALEPNDAEAKTYLALALQRMAK